MLINSVLPVGHIFAINFTLLQISKFCYTELDFYGIYSSLLFMQFHSLREVPVIRLVVVVVFMIYFVIYTDKM